MADYNLGTARGVIEIDASGAVRGAEQASGAADQVTGKWSKAGAGLTTLGTGLTAAAAVVAAGFGYAVKAASEFESQISGIAAVSGATEQELEQIRQKALQLGKDTMFSASESALAMEELVKAGLPVADVLNGAADAAVALAAAGSVSMPEAAEQISNAMNMFGIAASESGKVADQIAGAANASALSVGDFGMALKMAGGVANLAGVSFEDTATAIALMGQNGYKGSDAGTSLKTMFLNLQPTTAKQIKMFRELGLITADGTNQFFDQEGKLKSLAEVAGLMQSSMSGMTDQQKTLALETMFGTDAIRAAAVFSKEGAAGFDQMAGAMGKVTAEQVAMARMDNLAGDWEQLKGSMETLAITVGTLLLPALRSIVGFIRKLVDGFLELSPGTQKAIVAFVAIMGVIAGLVGVVLLIVAAVGAFMAAMAPVAAAIGITVGALVGWIAVIPIIIAAIVALAILIFVKWDEIKAFTLSVFGAIKDFLVGIWDSIYGVISGALDAVAGVVGQILSDIADTFTSIWNGISGVVEAVWGAMLAVVKFYLNAWKTVITTVFGAIKAVFSTVWGAIDGIVKGVLGVILAAIKLAMAAIEFVIDLVLLGLLYLFKTTWNAIKDAVVGPLNATKIVIESVWNAVKSFIGGILTSIKTTVQAAWIAVKAYIEGPLNTAKAAVSAIWNSIKSYVQGGVDSVMAKVRQIAAVAGIVADAFQGAYNSAKAKISALISLVGGIAGRVRSAVGNLGSVLYNAGRDIIQGLIRGVENMLGSLKSKLNSITNMIPDLKGPPVKDKVLLEQNGELIMQGLLNGIESQVRPLQSLLRGVTGVVVSEGPGASLGTPTVSPAAPSAVVPVARQGDSYHIDRVEIPARDLAEMQTVSDFFGRVQQEARRRAPVGGRV